MPPPLSVGRSRASVASTASSWTSDQIVPVSVLPTVRGNTRASSSPASCEENAGPPGSLGGSAWSAKYWT